MAIKSDFEKLETLYTAISDLNKVSADKNSDTKIDDAFNAIKDVNKSEFDDELQNVIINTIKDAVVKIYKEESNRLNNSIGLIDDISYSSLHAIPKSPMTTALPASMMKERRILNE